jgi:hypothetical protein
MAPVSAPFPPALARTLLSNQMSQPNTLHTYLLNTWAHSFFCHIKQPPAHIALPHFLMHTLLSIISLSPSPRHSIWGQTLHTQPFGLEPQYVTPHLQAQSWIWIALSIRPYSTASANTSLPTYTVMIPPQWPTSAFNPWLKHSRLEIPIPLLFFVPCCLIPFDTVALPVENVNCH